MFIDMHVDVCIEICYRHVAYQAKAVFQLPPSSAVAEICVFAHGLGHIHAHVCTLIHTHINTHVCTLIHTHVHTLVCTLVHTRAYTHACSHVYTMSTHMSTRMSTHVNTHVHTHVDGTQGTDFRQPLLRDHSAARAPQGSDRCNDRSAGCTHVYTRLHTRRVLCPYTFLCTWPRHMSDRKVRACLNTLVDACPYSCLYA